MMEKFKKITFILLILTSSGALTPVFSSEADILREIRNLREDLNLRFGQVDKRFEQIDKRFEQIDKRFDQVDKRFEQVDRRFELVDKRFDQMQWFFGLWIPVSMAIVGYILQRVNKHEDRFFELGRRSINANDIVHAVEKGSPEAIKKLRQILKG